jgi:hypothetical protein
MAISSLCLLLGGDVVTGVCGSLELSKRRPTGVERLFKLRIWPVSQTLAGLRIKSGAVRPANRLERKCKHNRISNQRFKIHVVIVNFIIKSFVYRVREKLGEFDLKRQGHLCEASSALPFGHNIHCSADQNAVMEDFQTHVDAHVSARHDSNKALAEALRNSDIEGQLTVLPRTVHQIVNGDLIDGVDKFNHAPIVRAGLGRENYSLACK